MLTGRFLLWIHYLHLRKIVNLDFWLYVLLDSIVKVAKDHGI